MIPVRWTSIEALESRKFSTASDVWSYGVVAIETFTAGEIPYGDWNNLKVGFLPNFFLLSFFLSFLRSFFIPSFIRSFFFLPSSFLCVLVSDCSYCCLSGVE